MTVPHKGGAFPRLHDKGGVMTMTTEVVPGWGYVVFLYFILQMDSFATVNYDNL